MNGRTLVHFTTPSDWDKEQKYHVGYCDYSGHRSRHGGSHFTATHNAYLTEGELYAILEPYMEHGPGNEPDLRQCDGCGQTFFDDELEIVDWDSDDLKALCQGCRKGKKP